MKKILSWVIATFVFAGFTTQCEASLITWNTAGNLGTETTEPSTTNAAGLSSSNLTLGAGVTAAANGNRFGGSGWFNTGNTVAGNTLSEAVAGNDFIQFIVSPNAGFQFTATSFEFIWDRSSTGPSSVTLRSSIDGFTTNLGSVTGMISGGAATTTFRTIPLSGLTNISSSTTFRLYGYGATATTGTGGFDTGNATTTPNVILNGTVSAIPEPTALLLVGSLVGLAGFKRRRK